MSDHQINCFFQAKILYKDIPFPEDERETIKQTIQSNVYGYLGILLEGRERFEDEILTEMKMQQSSCGTDSIGTISLFSFIFFHLLFNIFHALSATQLFLFPIAYEYVSKEISSIFQGCTC